VQAGTPLTASAKDVVFSKSEVSEYASYEVVAPAAIYNRTGNEFDLEVYGVKADGTEVLLDNTQYNLTFDGTVFGNTYSNGTNTISLTSALTTIDNNDDTASIPASKDFTFTVTIGNDAATQIETKVKVSTDSEDIAEIGFSTTGNHLSPAFDGANFVVDTNLTGNVLNATDLARYAYAKDVYGVYTNNFGSFDRITFSNLVKTSGSSAAINTATNGSALASVTGLQSGDKVTATVTKDGVSKTLDITVVSVADITAPLISATTMTLAAPVVTFNEALAVADGTDLATSFQFNDADGSTSTSTIVSAIYNSTANTITFTLTNGTAATALTDGDTITVKSSDTVVKDLAGNRTAGRTVLTVATGATNWR